MRFEFDFLNGRPIDLSPPSPGELVWITWAHELDANFCRVHVLYASKVLLYTWSNVLMRILFTYRMHSIRYQPEVNKHLYSFPVLHRACTFLVCMHACMCVWERVDHYCIPQHRVWKRDLSNRSIGVNHSYPGVPV